MMMKTSGAITIFRLMISFLLVAIIASGFVSGEKEIVLDTIGMPVKFYFPYHIFYEQPGANALICRYGSTETNGFSCPQRVVLLSDGRELRMVNSQVTFIPTSSDSHVPTSSDFDVVRVSTELKIRFQFSNFCEESGYWRAADSSLPIREIVLTGSKSSNDTTFTIQKSDVSYQFAYGSADNPTDIGFDSLDAGIRRLTLSNDYPFDIQFVPL